MISLNFDRYKQLRVIDSLADIPHIQPFLANIKTPLAMQPGFLDLPEQDITSIESVSSEFDAMEHIVIIGLGGSSLGPKTIVNALGHNSTKKTHFVDNIDPFLISQTTKQIDIESTVFLVITKSGQTPESISLFYHFKKLIEEAGHKAQQHCVLITDPEKGHLRTLVKEEGYTSLAIPSNVGGRFSVLTPVGLLLSSLLGLNIKSMLAGAAAIKESSMQTNLDQNPAFELAAMQYQEYQEDKLIHVIMSYSDQLSSVSDWCTQLYGESLGKINSEGESVGFTPHPARGVSDQHSQLQLFKEGPNDKCYIFLKPKAIDAPKIPSITDQSLAYLSDKNFSQLMDAEYKATINSLAESKRPLMEVEIPQVDEYNLGGIFMLFEIATAYLGLFLDVDTYNQPGVERSKILTREYLSANS